MKLRDIFSTIYSHENFPDTGIEDISVDTRDVPKGSLFILLEGENFDPHTKVQDIEDNVSFFIAEKEINTQKPYMIDPDVREKLSQIFSSFYDQPERKMEHIGITGTNGKTSVGSIIQHLYNGYVKTSYIGTLGIQIDKEPVTFSLNTPTTPQAPELFGILNYFVETNIDKNIMEVSSHALHQKRTKGIPFKYSIFTNLSTDHLDYHYTMENYLQAKKLLFDELPIDSYAIINKDDPYADTIIENCDAKIITYGIEAKSDFQATSIQISENGTAFSVLHNDEEYRFETSLIGMFNIYNLTAAISTCLLEGMDYLTIKNQVKTFKGVPGRLEKVLTDERNIYVDYAHSPDGLENVLETLNKLKGNNKIITVFGCGGDRDTEKRPLMGKIAEERSDVVIVTSDNPRTEKEELIMEDIKFGMEKQPISLTNREDAIKKAIDMSTSEDLILIAGKGHENYQIIGKEKIEFDDKLVSLEILQSRKSLISS
ncbi:UDP-N-acetylmuramoyl-L-alanyl-D-glutamate--2,6-diaminopimelate ligase [Virgibacillus natechei]|uniref:UDP-N-acetylmuramoyl-L-alanyl-D-glutamate--2,6-diaminopimelate ligase n=1 Tax=Virgibacillus natechei TaxID=1216297 RepID=A0ABS4IG47_9BACI|nr:UDP-N-acetylmuramoyl-L-alanyl-D-glutamate--2,6-diaminopimelate ligase [Virgibacillus natechei]MBP1969431.1 UDP-N-acetylmuramoyl-L-alanyl-D-glutamate--2,6-diaminopimelate ligase [Virgibacillus natechei]UZD11858.1 UDP-N-acetylmuramoyl-L-alanyl-D-glutamate--2,6-diaminopimelate ligase [Virgibacillus natechei]